MQLEPYSPDLESARHQLLQPALREGPTEYPIEKEYPLVLGPKYGDRSLCLTCPEGLLAHVNLWKRKIINTDDESPCGTIGLIGNVATSPLHRRKGIMSDVMEEIQDRASREGLQALVLWSDLSSFYSKLGFRCFGEEHRFDFTEEQLQNYKDSEICKFTLFPPELISEEIINLCKNLRYPTAYTLMRSPEEMRELLQIPDTSLLVATNASERIVGFFVLGRGYDMISVIHEWGAISPDLILQALRYIFWGTSLKQITLLAPGQLSRDWCSHLSSNAKEHRLHPVGLIWQPHEEALSEQILSNFYIWGLDSI